MAIFLNSFWFLSKKLFKYCLMHQTAFSVALWGSFQEDYKGALESGPLRWKTNKLKQLLTLKHFYILINCFVQSPNVSTTPITAMRCRQCLPLSVVQLKGKHSRKPYCCNGVVDTFQLTLLFDLTLVKRAF